MAIKCVFLATIYDILTFKLCNYLVRTLQYFFLKIWKKNARENIKNILKSSLLYSPVQNFHCCQPTQNQPKTNILLHKSCSTQDLYIMTSAYSLLS